MFYQILFIFMEGRNIKWTVSSSHQCVMSGQRERKGSCCVPRDQKDQAVLVFILINGRVRIKRSHGSNFCPLGFARLWECAFTPRLRRAKVIQQLKKSFFFNVLLLILHELQKRKRPLFCWGRKKQWWWCNSCLTLMNYVFLFYHPSLFIDCMTHIAYKTRKRLWKSQVPGAMIHIYKMIIIHLRK